MTRGASQMSSGAKVLASVLSFFGLLVGAAMVAVAADNILNFGANSSVVGPLFGVLFWVTWAIVMWRIWRRPPDSLPE